MSLFPNKDNILTKEIELWKGFADSLLEDDIIKMLDDCFKYAAAINAKGEPFLTEPLLIIKISEYNNWKVEKSIDM